MEDFGGDGTSEAVLGLLGTSGLKGVRDVSFVIGVSGVFFVWMEVVLVVEKQEWMGEMWKGQWV